MSTEIVLNSILTNLPGWDGLEKKDQIVVERETRLLSEDLKGYGRSRLAIGERLTNIQGKVPKGMFVRFLDAVNLKRSWAYNQMTAYRNAAKWLPKPVVDAAMSRNMNMLGITDEKPLGVYTDVVKRVPPPKTDDLAKIHNWLDNVEESRKRIQVRRSSRIEIVEDDPEVLLKQSYRYVVTRLNKLPSRGRARRAFLEALFGMLLSELGVSQGQTFEPQAIPEGFRAVVGRPTINAA